MSLTRQEASDAVTGLGWRFVLGELRTYVPVASFAEGATVAARVAAACGVAADDSLRVDLRADRAILTLHAPDGRRVGTREVELAGLVSRALGADGWTTDAGAGAGTRAVQSLEIAIDVLDMAAVLPFWRAVLGYADDPAGGGAVADPFREGPAFWFQQMTEPRPQRNRIHVDISVPHDEAARRIRAALAAGGTVVSDAAAPAFWVLADVEGNEACVTTWQGRD
ncbi:VOC family protein [Longispora sp. K20-0274]|uniref:VOC family protein n=1 Tax=Longispora sp. K20-0274 TaxID=3088255 RepID=UPI00399C29DB